MNKKGKIMRDVWSDDPDRTTAKGDTRTEAQVTAETFGWVVDSHNGITRYRAADGTATLVRDSDGVILRRYTPCCERVKIANEQGRMIGGAWEHSTTCERYRYVSETWLQG